MLIQTPYAQFDAPCRTGVCGQVLPLTTQFIQTQCVTCQARLERRICIRNLTLVESKLGLTKKCACGAPIAHDDPLDLCIECQIERKTESFERRRHLCSVEGCAYPVMGKSDLCTRHYWASLGRRSPCHTKGCHNERAEGAGLCEAHLAERRANKLARNNHAHPWRTDPVYL